MKKYLSFALWALLTLPLATASLADPGRTLWPSAPIVESRDCVLRLIAPRLDVALNPEFEKPVVKPEGLASLSEYQDAIQGFWGWRPEAFLNVFVSPRNEIYLNGDTHYYRSRGRSIFDSLAHELTHYLQFRYKGGDLADDTLEGEAVQVQTWFRETYGDRVRGDIFVCPL